VDTGANQELNFPVITLAYESAGTTTMWGSVDINSDPRFAIVEVFKAKPDPTGYGEGAVYLGWTSPDANGDWIITVSGVVAGDSVTATTTDNYSNTSEFSLCKEVLDATAAIDLETVPADQLLAVIGPNPAVNSVAIRYVVPLAGHVKLGVYDVSGRRVRLLVDAHRSRGSHSVSWDGRDGNGRRAAGGIYFVKLESAGSAGVTTAVLMR
jgi:hypothetical protein